MDYHKWIYRTRWLMAEVETAMTILTKKIKEYGFLPNLFCSGEPEAGTIMMKSDELRQKLRGVYYGMADIWPRIIENTILRDEAAKHLLNYTRLKTAFLELNSLMRGNSDMNHYLFRDSNLMNKLEKFFAELDDDMYYIRIELSGTKSRMSELSSNLSGLSYRMRKFLPDTDDSFFEKLINERELPPKPIAWHGQKADCARFLQHFGFTDEAANRIFYCIKCGKRLKKLKISSDIGRKGDESYPVMSILKDFPYNPE